MPGAVKGGLDVKKGTCCKLFLCETAFDTSYKIMDSRFCGSAVAKAMLTVMKPVVFGGQPLETFEDDDFEGFRER